MHNVQIKACKDSTWYTLSYMVMEGEVDQVVATWINAWKIGFGSTQSVMPSTSRKYIALKDTTKLRTEIGAEKTGRKNTEVDAKNEPDAKKDKE